MTQIAERVTINPVAENSALQILDLVGVDPSWGIYLLAHDYPLPPLETIHSGGADTEGDPVVQSKYGNRIITARVRLFEPPDPASTNVATNPVANSATTSWAGVSLSGGPTRILLENWPLGQGIDTAIEAKTNATGDYLYHEVAVTNGKTYRYSIWVQLRAKTGALTLQPVVYNAAGAVKKATGTAKVEVVDQSAEGWVRLDVSFTADATATWRVGVEQTAGTTSSFYATGVLVEESATLGPFFCGDTPGCDFTGTRHASTSTRPAPDGTRFSRIYGDVMAQLDRIKAQKSGTLRRVAPGFKTTTFDLLTATVTDAPQDISLAMKRAELGIQFEAKPGGRGAEIQIGGNFDETTKPALVFLAENVPGDMPALGRLLLEDRQGQNQLWVPWGAQRDTYSSSPDAELFYEAESRKVIGTSESTALAGSSGAEGKAIKSGALVNAWQAFATTQASGGNHAAHFGTYRVLARVFRPTANTGAVSLRFAWTEGDFTNVTENLTEEVIWAVEEAEGRFTLEDMGLVTIEPAPSGSTQRWEGRWLAKSTVAGDRIYLDCFLLVPTEVSGEARASSESPVPSTYSGFDGFEQTAGNLAAKTAGIGGTWAGEGDADDFTVVAGTSHWAQRTAVSDAENVPRYEILGTTKYTDILARLDVKNSNPTENEEHGRMGVLVRYVDVNNWVVLRMQRYFSGATSNWWGPSLIKRVAGTITAVTGILEKPGNLPVAEAPFGVAIPWTTLELTVLANGFWQVSAGPQSAPLLLASGTDADMGSAGALKEGKLGLYDYKPSVVGATRYYDNLQAYVPTFDAAIYASQSLEIRSDQVRREDKEGVTWGKPPYEGNYLLVPQSGPEKRPTRFIAKGSRNAEADEGIDDLRANLFVTPRYLEMQPS